MKHSVYCETWICTHECVVGAGKHVCTSRVHLTSRRRPLVPEPVRSTSYYLIPAFSSPLCVWVCVFARVFVTRLTAFLLATKGLDTHTRVRQLHTCCGHLADCISHSPSLSGSLVETEDAEYLHKSSLPCLKLPVAIVERSRPHTRAQTQESCPVTSYPLLSSSSAALSVLFFTLSSYHIGGSGKDSINSSSPLRLLLLLDDVVVPLNFLLPPHFSSS
ncbi:hypothetical protein Aperf_G00000039988 [Anoplocephala perfoliata]